MLEQPIQSDAELVAELSKEEQENLTGGHGWGGGWGWRRHGWHRHGWHRHGWGQGHGGWGGWGGWW